jgi:XTP/dITP diphosphohydrolase
MSLRIVLATHNPHKRDELLRVLRDELKEAVEILTLDDITPSIGDIEEIGDTLEENALIKAHAVHAQTHLPTIADDTGLEVTALGGAPGVYSARYAGEDASYEDNVQKLLGALQHEKDRAAKFTTVIAFIDERGTEHLFRGEVEGVITLVRRGLRGFGYDPIFAPSDDREGRTFAELTDEEKNAISHRGRALRKFVHYLHSI